MARDANVVLIASTTIAAAGTTTGTVFDCKTAFGNYPRAIPIMFLVTALSGTSTPTVKLVMRGNNTDANWSTAEIIEEWELVTAASENVYAFTSKYRYVRAEVVAATGGTIAATFTVQPTMAAQ